MKAIRNFEWRLRLGADAATAVVAAAVAAAVRAPSDKFNCAHSLLPWRRFGGQRNARQLRADASRRSAVRPIIPADCLDSFRPRPAVGVGFSAAAASPEAAAMAKHNKIYGKRGSAAPITSFNFEKLMAESSKRPSASKSAGVIGKWGTTSFTSLRSSQVNGDKTGGSLQFLYSVLFSL